MKRQLRVATAGSVDDGKSTLIGRLLHDTKTAFDDQLSAVTKASMRYGDGEFNLALLTDGLKAERQQGITIDVAYRYFATEHRSFVFADTPGHAEYTRNMVTGASVSDVAIVLIDARNGLLQQTRRHLFIASLLGVSEIILAVNKMDLVDWDESAFDRTVKEAQEYVNALPAPVSLVAVPLSALHGDNVVERSRNAPWYDGPSLLELLDHIEVEVDAYSEVGTRLAVQWVITVPNESRQLAGRLTGGALARGDEVVVLPSGNRSKVAYINRLGTAVELAEPGDSIAVRLEHEIDVGRGDVIVPAGAIVPEPTTLVTADVCWMIDRPLTHGSRWFLKHLTKTVKATVAAVDYSMHIDTLENDDVDDLGLNDLGRVRIELSEPIVADGYHDHRDTGRFVLIDEATFETAAAGMIVS